jgi:hypothetical protein
MANSKLKEILSIFSPHQAIAGGILALTVSNEQFRAV